MIDRNREIPLHQLKALDSRYRYTLRKIREEMKRPLPDAFRLQSLKRKRIFLKDQIADLLRPFSRRTVSPG
ncbi:MAG: YdcH family protein [Salaquimonas sp.]